MATVALLVLLALLVTVLSANALIEASIGLAHRFRAPEVLVGFTLLAVGTSLPEIAVAVAAALPGQSSLVFGNIYGSNLVNVCLGIGGGLLLTGAAGDRSTGPSALLGVGLALLVGLLLLDDVLGRIDGALLLGLTLVATVFLMRQIHRDGGAERQREEGGGSGSDTSPDTGMARNLVLAATGLVGLPLACDALVDFTTLLAQGLGVSERIIGFFLVAAGTSGPEIVVSVQCALRNRPKLLFGNIAGSNLFNLAAGLGLAGMVAPLITPPSELATQWRDWAAMLVAGVALLLATRLAGGSVSRLLGLALVLGYLGYALVLVT